MQQRQTSQVLGDAGDAGARILTPEALAFVADLQRTNVELEPLPGAEVEQLVVRTLNVPATVRDRAKLAFGR